MNTNTNHLLRYLYSFDEDVSRLNELHQTVQQDNESADLWSNFIRGSDFPVEENGLLNLDRIFDFDIPIIEPESVESTDNEMPQADHLSIDNHDNSLRNFYLVDEVNTRFDELDHTEQQNNGLIDIWSDFIGGSDLPIPNEENTWLDLECSFGPDISLIPISQ
ncbi:6287_t:CDS:1 [Ambispora leptoticha]|uniref:6287_t:CDS:1 n=1 Tax=Ambispora leptoticha TaxID=144679 RepID=A0A9N8Z1I2_9GLOM|nr:6287_t:CDS:1 [Ambispora leptoticha]